MNKRGLVKIGIFSILLLVFLFVAFSIVFSSAAEKKDSYLLEEKVKVSLNGEGDYQAKIKTPSGEVISKGEGASFLFKPTEIGNYEITAKQGDIETKYSFQVVESLNILNETGENVSLLEQDPISINSTGEDRITINRPVRWKKEFNASGERIILPKSGNITVRKKDFPSEVVAYRENRSGNETELTLQNVNDGVEVEYYTDAPVSEEKIISARVKEVKISAPDELHYENVLSYSRISEFTSDKNKIKIYWKEEQRYVDFTAYDKNGNGLIDYVEWNVPHLSNQTFDIIIITKAEHLDSNKEFISDIYEDVKALDGNWSEEIPAEDYVRVTFEVPLDNTRDITLYPRTLSGSPIIEVYEAGENEKIAEFTNLVGNQYNRVYLTNLNGTQDTFDLKVLNGSVEFDHIIDPQTGSFVDGGSTGTINTAVATPTMVASISPGFGAGDNLILAAIQVMSTDTLNESIPAEGLNLTRVGGPRLATNEYAIQVAQANTNNNYFMVANDSGAPENAVYNITAYSDATAVSTEAKIIVLSGVTNWSLTDSASIAFAAGVEKQIAAVPTSFARGDNVVVAAVQIDNGATVQDIAAGGIKIKNNATTLSSNQYALSLGTAIPTDKQDIVILALDSNAAPGSTYNVTVLGAQAGVAEAKVLVFRVVHAEFFDSGSTAIAASATDFARIKTTLPANSEAVVIAAGQFNDGDTNIETLAAGTGFFLREDGVSISSDQLIMSGFLQSGGSGDGIRHTLLWRNSTNHINPTYNLSATASATGLSGEGKILVLQLDDLMNPWVTSLTESPTGPATYSSSQTYKFNATITDDSLDLSTIKFILNGENYSASRVGNVSNITFPSFSAGVYNYSWYANDSSGNINITNGTYTVNKAIPAGYLTNTTAWTVTYPTSVTIGLSENNDGDGDVTYVVYRDNVSKGTGETITLPAETYTYLLNTTGAANYTANASMDQHILTINKAASGVNVTLNGTDNNITVEVGTTVNLTAFRLAGEGVISLYNNGTLINQGNGPLENLTLYNVTGWYNITVIYAATQNYSTSSRTNYVYVNDSIKPNVTLSYPADGFNSSGSTIVFNATVTDNYAILNVTLWTNFSGTWAINSTNTSGVNGVYWFSMANIPDGRYTWAVKACDLNNNCNLSENRTVTIDTSAPLWSSPLVSPTTPATYAAGQSYQFNLTWTDNFMGMRTVLMQHNFTGTELVNYTIAGNLTSSYYYNYANLAVGTYTWRMIANDSLGNTNQSTLTTYTVNKAASGVNVTLNGTDKNITVEVGTTVNLTAFRLAGEGVISLYNNGTLINQGNGPLENLTLYNVTGWYNITVIYAATQNYSGSSRTNYIYVNDSIKPNVTLSYPADGFNSSGSTIVFNATVTDNYAILNVTLWTNFSGTWAINSTNTSGVNGVYWFSMANIPDGRYTWAVKACDLNNNCNLSENRTVTIDTSAPSIELIYPENNSNITMSNINFTWNVTDNLILPVYCNLTVDGIVNAASILSNNGELTNYTVQGMPDGIHYWNVTCRDVINTNISVTKQFTVYTIGAPFDFNGTINSDNSSINLDWGQVSGATSYNVYITDDLSEGFSGTPSYTGITTTNFTDSTVGSAYRRFYKISSVKGPAENISDKVVGKIKPSMPLAAGFNMASIPLNLTGGLVLNNGVNNRYNPQTEPPNCILSIFKYTGTAFQETTNDGGVWTPAIGSEGFISLSAQSGYWFETSQECNITFVGEVPMQSSIIPMSNNFYLGSWYNPYDVSIGEEATLGNPFSVIPTDSIDNLFRYNASKATSHPELTGFQGTHHFPGYGWWPFWGDDDFTKLESGVGYYLEIPNPEADWTQDPTFQNP
jgi:hypothetical protein